MSEPLNVSSYPVVAERSWLIEVMFIGGYNRLKMATFDRGGFESLRGAVVRALTVGESARPVDPAIAAAHEAREAWAARALVHRVVAIDKKQQNVKVAAALGQHDVIAHGSPEGA